MFEDKTLVKYQGLMIKQSNRLTNTSSSHNCREEQKQKNKQTLLIQKIHIHYVERIQMDETLK